jgi:hypothetical protein
MRKKEKSKIKNLTYSYISIEMNGILLVMCDVFQDGKFIDCFVANKIDCIQ